MTPIPHDPGAHGPSPEEITAQINEILSRPAETLPTEVEHLEEAYRVLNEALS